MAERNMVNSENKSKTGNYLTGFDLVSPKIKRTAFFLLNFKKIKIKFAQTIGKFFDQLIM